MMDKVMGSLTPEMRVMAEACELTLEDEDRKNLNIDLAQLYEYMQNGDEEAARVLLAKWNAPPECYNLLAMALGFKALGDTADSA